MNMYSKEYFLSDCEGFIQYNASKGRVLSPRLKKIFGLAGSAPGMKILDIGCGRGELVLHAASCGAQSVGIDSSDDALKLAGDSLRNWLKKEPRIKDRADFIKTDCSYLPFQPDTFDVIFFSDIIEHLSPPDLEKTLAATYTILKPEGKIILHSSPNRIFVRYGLKVYNLLGKLYGKHFAWDMRACLPAGCRKDFHVNEQTLFSIKKTMRRTGFKHIDLWLEKNPQYIYYFFKDDSFVKRVKLLYRFFPIKHLFFADIFGVIKK